MIDLSHCHHLGGSARHEHFLGNEHFRAVNGTFHDEESLTQLTLDTLRTDNWQQDVYLRPTIYKSDMGIGVRLHDLKDEFCMFVMAFEKYVKNDTNAHVTFSSWRRIDDNVIPARGKVAGAYANSALIKTDANRAGFDEAIVLDQNGHVSEGSAMNIFMVRDGTLVTPPVTDNILEGITQADGVYTLNNDKLAVLAKEKLAEMRPSYVPAEHLDEKSKKVLRAHLNADGSIKQIPSPPKLQVILSYIVEFFEFNKNYTEKEVNTILWRFNEDTAGLRRDLVDSGMLARESDGSRYWRVKEGDK